MDKSTKHNNQPVQHDLANCLLPLAPASATALRSFREMLALLPEQLRVEAQNLERAAAEFIAHDDKRSAQFTAVLQTFWEKVGRFDFDLHKNLQEEIRRNTRALQAEVLAPLAQLVVFRELGVRCTPEPLGNGAFSQVFGLDDKALLLSTRPQGEQCYQNYRRQRLILRAVQQSGVNVPEIVAAGAKPLAYALMNRIDGKNVFECLDAIGQRAACPVAARRAQARFRGRVEFALGQELRKLHSLEVEGFGWLRELRSSGDGTLKLVGNFPSWEAYIRDSILQSPLGSHVEARMLPALRKIRQLKVLTERDLLEARKIVEGIMRWDMRPTFVHHDFHYGNVMYGKDGVTLIDWSFSSAGGGLVDELAMRSAERNGNFTHIFNGYGLPERQRPGVFKKIVSLGLMRNINNAGYAALQGDQEGAQRLLNSARKLLRKIN